MKSLPFDKPGRFYRGNLHTHSTVSDGMLSPEAVCQLYRDAGYDFLAITDHMMSRFGWRITDTTPYRTDEFTTLIGAELHAPQTEFGDLWHILAVGLPLDFARNNDDETGVTLTQRALATGAFVAIAHPDWYHLSEADALSLGSEVHAVEIFNGTSIDHNDKPGGWSLLDVLTARGHRYSALAVDDAHFTRARADALLGWAMVKSEALTPEAILEALKLGHYYSSTGPQIYDVEVRPGDKVIVHCSPVERVFVSGMLARSSHAEGNGITRAELSLRPLGDSPFGRVTVRDSKGGRAWTSPFWFQEIVERV